MKENTEAVVIALQNKLVSADEAKLLFRQICKDFNLDPNKERVKDKEPK